MEDSVFPYVEMENFVESKLASYVPNAYHNFYGACGAVYTNIYKDIVKIFSDISEIGVGKIRSTNIR